MINVSLLIKDTLFFLFGAFLKPSLILISWAQYRVVRSFSLNVFGVTDRTQGNSQFCVQVTEEMHVDCSHLCHRLFLSVWSERLITYCSVLEKCVNPREVVWFVGFTPVYF